jgi:hypothetical protein
LTVSDREFHIALETYGPDQLRSMVDSTIQKNKLVEGDKIELKLRETEESGLLALDWVKKPPA